MTKMNGIIELCCSSSDKGIAIAVISAGYLVTADSAAINIELVMPMTKRPLKVVSLRASTATPIDLNSWFNDFSIYFVSEESFESDTNSYPL